MDWFLYDKGLCYERVKHLFDVNQKHQRTKDRTLNSICFNIGSLAHEGYWAFNTTLRFLQVKKNLHGCVVCSTFSGIKM